MRRIISAREQAEMLLPWKIATPQKLYRGMGVNLPPHFFEQFGEGNVSEHPDFGSKLVDQLTKGYLHDGGLGTHWSTDPEVAHAYSTLGNGMPVTMEINHDGTGIDDTAMGGRNRANMFSGESEVMLHRDHPVELSRMTYGPERREVWNRPHQTST